MTLVAVKIVSMYCASYYEVDRDGDNLYDKYAETYEGKDGSGSCISYTHIQNVWTFHFMAYTYIALASHTNNCIL